jgi:hypothetical protein
MLEVKEPTPTDAQSHVAAFLVLLATLVLGYWLQRTNGHYNPEAIPWVVGAWIACLAALLVPFSLLANKIVARLLPYGRSAILFATLAVALYQLHELLTSRQDSDGRRLSAALEGEYVTLLWLATIGLTALVVWGNARGGQAESTWQSRARDTLFALLVLVHAQIGVWVLQMAINPQIDVWTVEMDSAKALMHGVNPFAITFPDPYHGTSPYFPPGVSVGGRLLFGFVYPPLCLLLCLPGYWIGDTRYATLLAMSVAAVLIARTRPQRTFGVQAMLAALIFLFTPRTYFVAHRAWTDPFVVMLTALVAYAALRRPKWLYVAAGLYCCVKQHMFIAAPALILMLPRPWSLRQIATFYGKAAAVALLVTLPLALWNVPAFVNSVLNIREVFRTDSLSVLAHLANTGGTHLSKWSGIGVAFLVCALGVWRAPRNASGFALVAAATHFSLYLFSTHAFCNEYYNVIGSLCVALACYQTHQASELSAASDGPPAPGAS